MHVGEISFCDKIGHNIKSDDVKRGILQEIEVMTGFKIIQKHHEMISDTVLDHMSKMPYVVTFRTNGNPYLLYMTRINNTPQCVFIDKKVQHNYYFPRMILSKIWMGAKWFENTLLDGEMTKMADGRWSFFVNDVLCLNGQYLRQYNLTQRRAVVGSIMQSYIYDPDYACAQVVAKPYFLMSRLPDLLKFLQSVPFSVRGLYFKPFYLKFKDVLWNFDDSLIKKVVRVKIKDLTDRPGFLMDDSARVSSAAAFATVCNVPPPSALVPSLPNSPTRIPTCPKRRLFLRKTNHIDVYDTHDAGGKTYGHALVNTMARSRWLRLLFKDKNASDRIELECAYCERFAKWEPIIVAAPAS